MVLQKKCLLRTMLSNKTVYGFVAGKLGVIHANQNSNFAKRMCQAMSNCDKQANIQAIYLSIIRIKTASAQFHEKSSFQSLRISRYFTEERNFCMKSMCAISGKYACTIRKHLFLTIRLGQSAPTKRPNNIR